ncbi:uncharacterized protein LOC143351920 [Colletes latitarsis]|uniref:uncharacterized protein LOC143351920 n=1 Tax=Colletes latitarsis TaxID=2605962 RepID=UPI00403559BF
MNFTTIQKCILLKCKINFNMCRQFHTTLILCHKVLIKPNLVKKLNLQYNHKNLVSATKFQYENIKSSLKVLAVNDNNAYSALQLKKRPKKRQKPFSSNEDNIGEWNIQALATAKEYDLESLVQGLLVQKLYIPDTISTTTSCKFKIIFSYV